MISNKRRILSFLLCLVLVLSSLMSSALGAESEKQKVAVSLSNIYDLAYKNNVNSKIAQTQLELYYKNEDDFSDALDAAWDASQAGAGYGSVLLQSLMSQQTSSEDREITKLSTENTKKQAAIGSKSMLISYYALENERIKLKSSEEICTRNLNSAKIRKTLGMATDIEVEGLEQTQKKLVDAVNETENAISVLKSNLSIYIGVAEDGFSIAPFESETSEQITKKIDACDYKKDLESAQKNCYKLNMQKLASDDRSSKRSYVDSLTYDSLKAKFPVAFKETFETLKTKTAALKLAEGTYSVSKKTADAASLKFKFGIISQKDNQDAIAQQEQDKCTLISSQLEYALAQNNYLALKDGIWAQ